MEAALAFTGLAASLVTLLAVVHDSCKTIHAVSGFYKKAPRLLIQLKDDVDRTEDLLRAIVIQSRRRKSELVSEELRELWDKTRAQLETDYKEINSIVKKLHKKSRVNFYFKGDQIESLKIRIGRHIETLILIRSLATSDQIANVASLLDLAVSKKALPQLPTITSTALLPQTDIFHLQTSPLSHLRIPRREARSESLLGQPSSHTLSYSLIFGELLIESTQSHRSSDGDSSFSSDRSNLRSANERKTICRITFIPVRWFSKITVETTLAIMKTAAGQLPGFQWACNSFTTHIVPEKHHECSCVENRERCFSWPEGYCEKELLLLCGQRHVRAADKVLLTKGFTKEAIPIIQVLFEIFLQRRYFFEDASDVLQATWDIIDKETDENMSNVDASHMISQGFAVPSQRAAQFVKKLLVAGASSPAQIDLCCTLRYSGLSENYLFEAQPEMCVLPGLHYLQETLPLLDLGSIDHSKRPDIWILACLARECADVRNAWLDVIMLGFQGSEQASLLDVKVLVKYMVSSESSLRIECLDCLASGGSAGMLAPLLAEGVDIDMRSGEYLKLAITNCNFDAAWAILEQGYPVSEDVLRFFFSSVTTGLTSRHFSRRLQLAFARGESFVRFFDRLMKDVDLQEYHAPPTDWMESMCDDDDGYDKAEREFEDHTLTKVVLFMMSIILPGSVHNVRHRYLVAIENSRNYPEWPMRTGVSIVEILLKAGILRDRHLCPRIPPYDRSGKWFGNWWRGSPITTALYYCNETQIEIIKLFIKYGHDLEDETEDGTTAFLLAIEYRSHLFAKILIEGGSDLQRKNSKGIVPWKALLRRWWEDMYAAERAEEISLETGEFSEEAAHWERLVRDFYVQRGLDCDTELEKEFKHSEESQKPHTLPPGWHVAEYIDLRDSKDLFRPLYRRTWPSSHLYNRTVGYCDPADGPFSVFTFDCPCTNCLIAHTRQCKDSQLAPNWKIFPWPVLNSQTSEFDTASEGAFHKIDVLVRAIKLKKPDADIECPHNPNRDRHCQHYHQILDVAHSAHAPFATVCCQNQDDGEFWQIEEPWFMQNSADGQHTASRSMLPYSYNQDWPTESGGSMSSYTISTLVPYYVDVKAEKRTWDCPCSKCQESGNEIAVEGPEERAKAAKALLESTTKHQEIQYSPPDVMSPNFQTFVCTECIERKERSRDDPKDPIHWIPRTVPELKARLSHFGRLLIHKAQLYDKTVSWGPTAPFYEDHVLAFIGVCVSVVLIRMLEGLAALQILHRKLADGGRHQKMAVVVCLSSIYVACWIGQSRGY